MNWALVSSTPVVNVYVRSSDRTALSLPDHQGSSHGTRRVIIVTSPYRTRRARIMWNRHYQDRIPAVVYPTPYERFDPHRWWRSRRDLQLGVHELIGILHFWIESPLSSFDRALNESQLLGGKGISTGNLLRFRRRVGIVASARQASKRVLGSSPVAARCVSYWAKLCPARCMLAVLSGLAPPLRRQQ